MSAQPDNVTPLAAKLEARRAWRAIPDGDGAIIADAGEALAYVRKRLQHDGFAKVVQHGTHDPAYSLVFAEEGAVPVGDDLGNVKAVRKALNAVGIHTPVFSPSKWGVVERCLVALREVDDEDPGAEEAREWLQRYVGERLMGAAGPTADTVMARDPFYGEDGRLYLSATGLTRFVARSIGVKVTTAELRRRLTRLGFDKAPYAGGQVSVRDGDRIVKNRYLASPVDSDPAA
jgi:hypothetical protein